MTRGSDRSYLTGDTDVVGLGRTLPLGRSSRVATERAYYDTFDGRLHRAGLSLVHEGGRLTLFDGDQERAGQDRPRSADRFFVAELPRGSLRELLAPLVDVRALTRIARLRTQRQVVPVVDDEGKTVVRLIFEEPRLVGAGDDAELRPRLHAAGVRGYDKELKRVCRTLEQELGLERATPSLQDEAVTQTGGVPGGLSSKPDVRLEKREEAGRAASRILRRLLEVIELNLPGTLADVDSEFLHDLRVAVRRTRSIQRELRGAFPAETLTHFRMEFRWLQAVTGPSRDLDVWLLEFDDVRAELPEEHRADLDPLHALLVDRRRRERRRMVQALRSARTASILSAWADLVDALERGDSVGPDAARPISELAGARLAKVYRQMVKEGVAITADSPAEALHDLRKKSKELRYLLEFFGGLYPGRVAKPMVRTLKALQDTLGRFQDRQVQAELLRSLGDEVAALDGGATALLAMGQLIERLEEQQAEARDEFAERFAAFASRRQRALVRETFA